MNIGYARTSTTDQTNGMDAQRAMLTAHGCERVFAEHISSRAVERPQLDAVIDYARDGDLIVVTKPDRLARSTQDLLTTIDRIQARGAELVILSMGGTILDTSNPTSKLMLTMLAAVAEFERDIMLERQRDGIALAKDAGKYKGRPVDTKLHERIRTMLNDGMAPATIARELNVARSTVYRVRSS